MAPACQLCGTCISLRNLFDSSKIRSHCNVKVDHASPRRKSIEDTVTIRACTIYGFVFSRERGRIVYFCSSHVKSKSSWRMKTISHFSKKTKMSQQATVAWKIRHNFLIYYEFLSMLRVCLKPSTVRGFFTLADFHLFGKEE